MHSRNASRHTADLITNHFAHQGIPTNDGPVGPILIKATCLQCGTEFTEEISWLLHKERDHLERCNVVPIRSGRTA